jgi:Zn-dependent metalloprotease
MNAFSFAIILSIGLVVKPVYGFDVQELASAKAQRQSNADTRTSLRRSKQPQYGAPTSAAPALSVAQLQRALRGSTKSRGRQTDKSGLIDAAQQRALFALNAQTQSSGGVQAHFDGRNGTLAFLKPPGKGLDISRSLAATPSVAPADVALEFMSEQRALFKLDDPRSETRVMAASHDNAGRRHVRLQQVYQGVPLWGKEILVHLQADNSVYLVQGSYQPTPHRFDTSSAISEEQALAAVRADLQLSEDVAAQSELIIYTNEAGEILLAYKIDIAPTLDQRWIYFVDAQNGGIAHRINNIHADVVAASGPDLHGVNRSFNAWRQAAESFYLIDPSTPVADAAYNPLATGPNISGDTFVFTAQNGDGSSLDYITSATTNGGWDPAAVSAAHGARVVYDYYKNTFGRDSIDGNGMNLLVVTHFQNQFNNAFWNGAFMVFGDGDGQLFDSLAGCLDVAAHEMTHGVIERSANLIYQNQSGALNESFADIFGAMVDREDWMMGEDCTVASPGFLRDLQDPAQGLGGQPAKMSEYTNLPNTVQGDYGGVHINSGIPNRAAYLTAEGLSAEGLGVSIGRAKTEQIFYRALTEYLTASAQFIDARRATLQAAADLYGDGAAEVQAVTLAWNAVEVTDSGSGDIPPPTSTDAVSGSDVMVYLYPQDGEFNDFSETFDLYKQTMDDPFNGYNGAKDIGPFNTTIGALHTRPAVYTSAEGTSLFYVGIDYNLYGVDPVTNQNLQLTSSGDIWSVAVSPDGRYFAYTTATGNNIITVLDMETDSSTEFSIIPPNYQQDGSGADTIFYADSLFFDYSSRHIVFDALSCIGTPDDQCSYPSGGYQYWSIGELNVTNGQLSFPFPNQNPIVDLGYPAFAANNQAVIALDYVDWTNAASGAIASRVITFNLETQSVNTIYSFADSANPHYAMPSFWGDDDYLTFSAPDEGSGSAAYRIALDKNWEATGALQAINSYAVVMPVMHRAGERVLTGGLTTSTATLDFGQVTASNSKSLTFTLINNGNNDVNITNVSLASGVFAHNATNTRVPRGSSVAITVTFAPGTEIGTQTGALTFYSDGEPAVVAISLVGASVASQPVTAGGGGGGGASGPWIVFMLTLATIVFAKVRKDPD